MLDPPLTCSISYRRSRFSTRLLPDRRYTASHFWLLETAPGLWRVGFTKFATRMLGDIVEYQFDVGPGTEVEVGQKAGSIEGFKAVSDIYCVASGVFAATNEGLRNDITLIE